jgi:hypothetical protein
MKRIIILSALSVSISAFAAAHVSLEQLQGAWWSDTQSPTAAFAIRSNEVWLDSDSKYHPCKIEGDILVFKLGEKKDTVKNRIISVNDNLLILENVQSKQRWRLRREQP